MSAPVKTYASRPSGPEASPTRQRVLVDGVDRQTPAAAAGLERGDEILRVAECSVCSRFDVERALWDRKPGEQVSLTLVRQGQERSVQLTLARATASERMATSAATSMRSGKTVPAH